MIGRRAALLGSAGALTAGSLAGCGFRPLYLPQGGAGSPASVALAAIYVPPVPERSGQLLRQALQRRIEGSGTGIAKRYELVATMAVAAEGIAVQRDSSTSRIRVTGTSVWSLRELNLAHTVLTTGNSRVLDGYNILNQQYFAAELESDTVTRRVAEALADQIIIKLALFLTNPAAAKAAPGPAPLQGQPGSIPYSADTQGATVGTAPYSY